MSIKIKILKTIVCPIATNGCETWTTHASDGARINAFEMIGYRNMPTTVWIARRTNESVLQERNVDRKFLRVMRRKKLHFFGTSSEPKLSSLTICKERFPVQREEGGHGRGGSSVTGLENYRRSALLVVLDATIVPDPQN